MISDRFFIIAAQQPWSGDHPSDGQAMAARIARQNRVLYVNPPYDPMSLVASSANPGGDYALDRLNPNLWVLEAPIILPVLGHIKSQSVFDTMNQNNNRQYADAIRWALSHLEPEDRYLICDNDPVRCFYLPQLLHPAMTVYYRHGEGPARAHPHPHARRLEADMARKSDLVAVADDYFTDELSRYNPDTFHIGRGSRIDGDSWEVPVGRLYAAMAMLYNPEEPEMQLSDTLFS